MTRLLDQDLLAQTRSRRELPEWAPAWQRLRQSADLFLDEPLQPPDEKAGFYHAYFCPDHAVQLVFAPDRPTAHRCPVDDRVFSGPPYDAAWRWFVNNRLSTMAYELALVWTLDDDAACRQRVEEILSGYAARYSTYQPGKPRPYGQGKATFQSLDESVWLVALTRAYDLVRDALDPSVRKRIEEDLLRPAAAFIITQKYFRIHNIECWHNAAIAAVGLCLDVAEWKKLAIDDDYGFRHQLEEGVRADGLWWEGSSSYHFYALAALMSLAQMAATEQLWKAERLEKMWLTPVELVGPDWRQPATNDCWFSSSLLADVCHGVPPAAAFYEVAWGWYGNPLYVDLLEENYRRGQRDSIEALLYGRELPDHGREMSARARGPLAGEQDSPAHSPEPSARGLASSTDAIDWTPAFNAGATGLARFRSPAGDYLLLKYGPHGGGHGHPDKLALSLYARGYPLSPDLGTPGYGIDLNSTWYRQTLSHNTVVIDAASQPEAEGQLTTFGERADFAVADARVHWEEGAYADIRMRRLLLWRADYFVDFFLVECDRPRQVDWALRLRGTLENQEGVEGWTKTALEGDGYQHIEKPLSARVEQEARLEWSFPTGRLALHLPCERETAIIQGQVPYNPASETSDLLIRRRQVQRTAFIAVLHAWEEKPVVQHVRAVDTDADVWAFLVECRDERHLWTIGDRDDQAPSESEADRIFRYTL